MKKILFLIFFVALLVSPLLAFGDDPYDPNLEIEYPWLEDADDETEQVGIYIAFLFEFGVMIVGLILFGTLVYSGFIFMISAGNPEKRSEAIRKILSAFLGAILLLGFYVLINEINPALLQVSLEEPEGIEYPPLPAGPYICNFEFSGLDAILSDYESADTRNNAIQQFYETLKAQDSDKYCMEIKTPKNTNFGYLEGGSGNYFIIPKLDGENATYNHGIILFAEKDGLKSAKTSGDGIRCVVSVGEVTGGEIDTDIKSVAPIKLDSEGEGQVIFYEGYNFNAEDDPKNTEYTGEALAQRTRLLSLGSTELEITKSMLEDDFTCDMMSGFWSSDKYHCGVRSFKIGESAPIFAVFKTEDGSYERCNITNTNRGDLSSLLPGSIITGNDDLKGLTQVFKFNEVHLIKGYLMDAEK
ncbi:MAG: pilin [Patescibacteria group bacterium]|nr:pilin [Patescibacteria group bacterium]